MSRRKQFARFIVVASAAFLLGVYLYNRKEKNSIKENLSVATCNITSVQSGYRGGMQLTYAFNYKGKEYKGECKHFISYAYAEKFLNYSFPVAFNKNNPAQNTLLLLPDDFHQLNFIYPDSLDWVAALKEKSL